MTVTHPDNMDNMFQLQITVVCNPWNNVVVAELIVDCSRQAETKLAAAWAYHSDLARCAPLSGIIAAITSFNHPLTHVVCKVAPAIITNNHIVLNPSAKTPSSSLTLHKILT